MKIIEGYWPSVHAEAIKIQDEAKMKGKPMNGEVAFWLAKDRIDKGWNQPELGDIVQQTFSLES